MELKQYLKQIEKFLQDYLIESHTDGYVLGISGGVDSSLVAALTASAVGKEKLHCILIPIESLQKDVDDGVKLCKSLSLNYKIINADEIYRQYISAFIDNKVELDKMSKANLKTRIRMSILYAYAQKHNCLVVGTDNADERYVGYFTKYGDGGVDLLPIVYLVKREVVEAAKIYRVPTFLAERIPSAGLFEGQTDEAEMGIKYKDIDDYLLGKPIDEEAKRKIERMHKISEHKRKDLPTPGEFNRDE